jgi:TolB-like protein/Tfp pilus assembly protein PilF
MGDVMVDGQRIYGDGINIAARLEGMAEPGGICISGTVHEQIRDKLRARFVDLGEKPVKNLPHPVRVYRVEIPAEGAVPVAAIAPRPRHWVALAGGVLIVAVAAVVWWSMTPRTAPPTSLPTSIVVLPFADMSPDGDQEYFADGMAEELINTLSKIEGLRVVARTSAFAFKGKDVGVREIGDQLDVGAVVEGSVRKAGDRLRITAQLVTVEDGFHLWSETYDRKLGDVFAIQDEIGAAVARALEVRLGNAPVQGAPTQDLQAYELYLTGRFFWNRWTEANLRKAIDYFEQALEVDPDYARAYAGLADAYILLGINFGLAEGHAKAREAATRALELDDSIAEGHASLGYHRLVVGDWAGAEVELERALALNPGYSAAHHWYAGFLMATGQSDESLTEMHRALELDPVNYNIRSSAGGVYLVVGDYEPAIEHLRRALELSPGAPGARVTLAYAYHLAGREAEAVETALDQEFPPQIEAELREAAQGSGLREVMRRLLKLEIARTGEPCTEGRVLGAAMLAFTGERERALDCLEQAAEQGLPINTYLKLHPAWDPLREEPRFTAILGKMGLEE